MLLKVLKTPENYFNNKYQPDEWSFGKFSNSSSSSLTSDASDAMMVKMGRSVVAPPPEGVPGRLVPTWCPSVADLMAKVEMQNAESPRLFLAARLVEHQHHKKIVVASVDVGGFSGRTQKITGLRVPVNSRIALFSCLWTPPPLKRFKFEAQRRWGNGQEVFHRRPVYQVRKNARKGTTKEAMNGIPLKTKGINPFRVRLSFSVQLNCITW